MSSIHIDLIGETAEGIAKLAKIHSRSKTKEVEVACKAHIERHPVNSTFFSAAVPSFKEYKKGGFVSTITRKKIQKMK